MPPTEPTALLLQRLAAGDPGAQGAIIDHACDRLRRLTRKMLQGYDRLRRWEETDDVLQQAMIRLHRSLSEVKPASPRQFYGLAAVQIRRTLLDLVRHYFGPEGSAANHHTDDVKVRDQGGTVAKQNDPLSEPNSIAGWCDFHEAIEKLPDEEREVLHLLFYDGLTQLEAAEILGVTERTVRRRWYDARLALQAVLDGGFPE
jgi:RNA polymerase sigma factor (sigma-70 family)